MQQQVVRYGMKAQGAPNALALEREGKHSIQDANANIMKMVYVAPLT